MRTRKNKGKLSRKTEVPEKVIENPTEMGDSEFMEEISEENRLQQQVNIEED